MFQCYVYFNCDLDIHRNGENNLAKAQKINHKFLKPIFSKINEAGRLYLLIFYCFTSE